jgi:hypothetical protein
MLRDISPIADLDIDVPGTVCTILPHRHHITAGFTAPTCTFAGAVSADLPFPRAVLVCDHSDVLATCLTQNLFQLP